MITLKSNLLGAINAKTEKVVATKNAKTANKEGAVLVSAEILGEVILGKFNPEDDTVEFFNRQSFYGISEFTTEKYLRVVKQLKNLISDAKTRKSLSWSFKVKIENGFDELYSALETLPIHIEKTPVKNTYTPRLSEEDSEWLDDQYGHLLLNSHDLPDDSNIDDIEETPRVGAN